MARIKKISQDEELLTVPLGELTMSKAKKVQRHRPAGIAAKTTEMVLGPKAPSRAQCQNEKTFDGGPTVRCAGWATHGNYCENCSLRLGLTKRARRDPRDCTQGDVPFDKHRWDEDGTCLNPRCQIMLNDSGNFAGSDKGESTMAKKKAAKKAKAEGEGRVLQAFRLGAKAKLDVFKARGEKESQAYVIAKCLQKLGTTTSRDLAAAVDQTGLVKSKQPIERVVGFYVSQWRGKGLVVGA